MAPAMQMRRTNGRSAAIAAAYFVATAIAVGLTRLEGGVACVWIAGAVLLSGLISSRTREWPTIIASCIVSGTIASMIWGVGWPGAPLLATINTGEPLIAAMLIRRWRISRSALDSLPSLSRFFVAAGIVAPLIAAFPGAALVTMVSATVFTKNLVGWYIAHALGMLTFTPVFYLIATGEFGGWLRSIRGIAAAEAAGLIGLVAIASLVVFLQNALPLLFLPALPLMIVTFRVGRFGAALGVVLIAVIGGIATLQGHGPVTLLHGGAAAHIQFFQFYVTITVMTVLPVTADLTRRERLFAQLRDSEARFRLLTENSTDIVMNVDVDGAIRYVSPSIARLAGHDAAPLLGRASMELIDAQDRDRVRAAHLRALRSPGETVVVEFRGIAVNGEQRWFETNMQAVQGADGQIAGVVSASRETSLRKQAETELTIAADTDPLTGLCNRRVFDRRLEALLAADGDGDRGCVAVFDLDHFKRVNDTFGHAAGDQVLKAFAAAAAAYIRDGDVLARIGGEEFGLIFPGVPMSTATAICERIRVAVAAITVTVGEWPLRTTVSIGVTAAMAGQAPAAVMRSADQALYEAKALGRNRAARAA